MKRVIAVVLVGAFLCLGGFTACTWLQGEVKTVETKIQSVNWDAALAYWNNFVKFANEAVPVVNAVLKNNTGTLAKITTGIADANTAVNSLAADVAAYKAGTLDEATVIASAQTVQKSVVAIVNEVAPIVAQSKVSPVAPVNPTVSK